MYPAECGLFGTTPGPEMKPSRLAGFAAGPLVLCGPRTPRQRFRLAPFHVRRFSRRARHSCRRSRPAHAVLTREADTAREPVLRLIRLAPMVPALPAHGTERLLDAPHRFRIRHGDAQQSRRGQTDGHAAQRARANGASECIEYFGVYTSLLKSRVSS